MGKKLVKGNMCTFFASIKDAGIVDLHQEWNGSYTDSWYTIGPNWNHYLNGNLKRKFASYQVMKRSFVKK